MSSDAPNESSAAQVREIRYIRAAIDDIETTCQREGIDARFLDAHTLELANGDRVRARHVLIGSGSRASVPPIPGLAETRAWIDRAVIGKAVLTS